MILHFSFYYKPVEVKFGKEAVKISGKSQELRDKEGLRIHGMRSQFLDLLRRTCTRTKWVVMKVRRCKNLLKQKASSSSTYPNNLRRIENGTTHNDIKVITFSISPYTNILGQALLTTTHQSSCGSGSLTFLDLRVVFFFAGMSGLAYFSSPMIAVSKTWSI